MYGVGYPVLQRAVAGHYVDPRAARAARGEDPRDEPDDVDRRLGRRVRAVAVHGRDARLGLRRGRARRCCRDLAAAAGAYGLVGMGAVFAAAARAPITAVLIIFELTGDYRIILPLMFAVVVATALANALTDDTIYTLKLRRRGIDIDAPAADGLMAQIARRRRDGRAPAAAAPEQPLRDVLDRFASERADALPVIDAGRRAARRRHRGRRRAGDRQLPRRPDRARALVHETPELRVDESLEDAVTSARRHRRRGPPGARRQTARRSSDGSHTGACCAPTTHTWRTDQEPTRQPGASLPSQRSDSRALAPMTARRHRAHGWTEESARR